jgi:hypothetical protein
MSQTAPSSDRTVTSAAKSSLTPPDERFWQRYSPHAEFPLSSAGSFAIHAILFGLLALLAFLGTLWFNQGGRSLPVEAVRLDLGGGGGHPRGHGDGPNRGQPQEAGSDRPSEGPTEDAPQVDNAQPKIDVKPNPRINAQFDAPSLRYIQQVDTETAQAYARMSKAASRIRVTDATESGRGQGGKGSGGGSGDGQGTGTGDGRGEGKGNLTKREKRMIRWFMGFNSLDARDYLAQLQGLGAILAVPIREDANGPEYRVIRDLSGRPPQLLEEDIAKLNRIYWYDDKPASAAGVMEVLRLNVRPSHFIAFMPLELEDKLYQMEKKELEKHPGRTEDDIAATRFKVEVRRGKYVPVLKSLKLKK